MASEGPDFKALFEGSPGMLIALDSGFDVVAVSDAYLATFGIKREETVGRSIFEVLSAFGGDYGHEYRERLLRSLERVRDMGVADSIVMDRLDLPPADDPAGELQERYWTSRNSPVSYGRGRLRYIIRQVDDVTDVVRLRDVGNERQLAYTELEHRTVDMAAELVARSQQLETANALLLQANEAKNEFLSRMSHELRTPLAAILGFSELLATQDLDDTTRHRVETIEKAGQHLLMLVTEVLDIARIEAGELTISIEPVAVTPVIEEALALMHPDAERGGVRLNDAVIAPDCHYVLADGNRLKQIMINLISNAIKYNGEAGEVTVTVAPGHGRSSDLEAASSSPAVTRISVRDGGAGLDAASLEKLFVPFERLAATATSVEGTGLGLAVSKALVEAMGGTIGVDSTVGEGSTFWIELESVEPRILEESSGHLSASSPREYQGERTVLYIEDTAVNVRLMREILELRPSVQLLSAADGASGIEIARERQPDLIIIDLHLPDLSGVEVLEILAAEKLTAEVPVVVLTADATYRERDRALAAGAREYLTKPIGLASMLNVLDRFLEDHDHGEDDG
jgi:signal transduction histidine kinase/CheY-like chemotaxis protein